MEIKIALAGNPNCGKTTMFNQLTGSSQYVGNWPGVTVEKKEGKLKGHKDVKIVDLPGIYSLSPYTLEEVVSRNFLINEKPDAIVNIVDGTNIERNLYLTTQLLELGIPVVIAMNLMDIVRKNGDNINISELSEAIGCEIIETSALKGEGCIEAAEKAIAAAKAHVKPNLQNIFSEKVEWFLNKIENKISDIVNEDQLRWYAVKLLERDEKINDANIFSDSVMNEINEIVAECENELDDDGESIITNERYEYITRLIKGKVKKAHKKNLSPSDKIDRIVTNRFLAIPIFAVVIWLVYFISVSTVGTYATDWANDGVFGDGWHLFGIGSSGYEDAVAEFDRASIITEAADAGNAVAEFTDENGDVSETLTLNSQIIADAKSITDADEPDPADYGVWIPGIPPIVEGWLESANAPAWLDSLILDGIIGGVGAVLGFLPQMLVLFLFLAILEDCGYMARIAFIMDRIFRKFGLSGKSFIPILIGTGCGVPGIMASRTIENERDRKMTIMTTTFIPCGAKLPIIALIAGALFNEQSWVAPVAYFIGLGAIIVSGIILKKTQSFAGEPAPFVMELPAYHVPGAKGVLIHMWDRAKSFVIKAGTIIFIACAVIWFLSTFSWSMKMVDTTDSMLADIGKVFAPVFAPLGWGNWQSAVAAITGLVAKENVVGTFGVLFGYAEVSDNGNEIWSSLQSIFTPLSAFSFLVFNLLCAPCFAAIGAIRREMGSAKWTLIAVGYQTVFAYAVSLIVYQFGRTFTGHINVIGFIIALLVFIFMMYMLFRPYKESSHLTVSTKTSKKEKMSV